MKINKTTAKIIYDIEEIIGSNCYNTQTRKHWKDTPGNFIRYPATIWKDGKPEKIHSAYSVKNINAKPKDITTLEYRFGANLLQIGDSIIEVLEMLENRYGLDFYELEKNRNKNK